MKIAIGSDHAGFELKQQIVSYLQSTGYEVTDVGTHSTDSTDYPIYAKKVAKLILDGDVARGILICGTGIGIGITANKFRGIRCGICSEPFSAKMSIEHNNANCIAFGSRVVDLNTAKEITKAFLEATFEGGRHQNRIEMIESK